MAKKRSSKSPKRRIPDDRAKHQGFTLLLFLVALALVITATLMTV